MKIKFIYPKFDKFLESYPELSEMPAIAFLWSFTMPPGIAIPIMITMLPDDVEWHIQDQNIEEIEYDDDSDIIAISYFTPQAGYAYDIGDKFLSKGKTVIMGGMHATMIPEDVLPHCTSLCIGEVDTIFRNIINDYRSGNLKKIYKADNYPEPNHIISPKISAFNDEKKYDWHASLINLSRGCPYKCDWCNIPLYQGKKTRLIPIGTVVENIKKFSNKELYIIDDVFMINRPSVKKHINELCEKIKDFNIRLFLSGSPAMNRDPEFLDMLAKAGTKSIYVVFANDSVSIKFYNRHQKIWQYIYDLVQQIEDRGMRFFASFGLGFDSTYENQFDLILEFCTKAHIKTAEFFIATPFPGTPFWKKIEQENRFILPRNWTKYNCAHVVFLPENITSQQLIEGFIFLWKEFYRNVNIEESLLPFSQNIENIIKAQNCPQLMK